MSKDGPAENIKTASKEQDRVLAVIQVKQNDITENEIIKSTPKTNVEKGCNKSCVYT